MELRVYNTLTGKKEEFRPLRPGKVGMYLCGPTVYKPSHIGHMVGPVIFDTVKRFLTYLGYEVTFVVNITDVDDKLIARARELKTTVPELAGQMTKDYLECLHRLNVTGIDQVPRATEHIAEMQQLIQTLIARGFAYPSGGDVYFDVSRDDDYGKLCNRDPEQLEAGARIEVSERKRNPGDFALWKGAKPGEPQWDSPWGPGRPGWHIECSAMSMKVLGQTLDIHGGGLDLKFPHHENELAQSESCTGLPFARYWMHNGLLELGTKMAGSLGNVINVVDALKHLSGDVLRFFFLSTQYRSPISLGKWDREKSPLPEGMLKARTAFDTFLRFVERVERITGMSFAELPARTTTTADRTFRSPRFGELYGRFREYMADDFNTGGAVAVLFELVNAANKLADEAKLESAGVLDAEARAEFLEGVGLFKEIGQVLGLTFALEPMAVAADDGRTAALVQLIVDLRSNLRAEAKKIPGKDEPLKKFLFDQATLVRKELEKLGVVVEDREGGTTWRFG